MIPTISPFGVFCHQPFGGFWQLEEVQNVARWTCCWWGFLGAIDAWQTASQRKRRDVVPWYAMIWYVKDWFFCVWCSCSWPKSNRNPFGAINHKRVDSSDDTMILDLSEEHLIYMIYIENGAEEFERKQFENDFGLSQPCMIWPDNDTKTQPTQWMTSNLICDRCT